jgi:hypothetical protein
MPNRFAAAFLCVVALTVWVAGCAPQAVYREGPLATEYRMLSKEDLDHYAARIDDEIARVEKGAAPPAGVSRESYLDDLKSRRYEVRTTIEARESIRQDERRQEKDKQRTFPLP